VGKEMKVKETKFKDTKFKDTLFIGSSSEGLSTAQAIKKKFDAEMDVTLWNEGVFKMNASYLESLLRASNSFDFAILVFTPDDLVTSRSQTQSVPRDNVIFEHGLFLGRLGPPKSRVWPQCRREPSIQHVFLTYEPLGTYQAL
jgi:predicted nucleotide-binding protein